MVKKIKVSVWSFNAQINRETFNEYLVNLISEYIDNKDQIEKIILTFPTCLTKSQRHDIHKLNVCFEFGTASYDTKSYEDDERFIEVTLSKNYVNDLFKGYVFKNPQVKTDKQVLFDSLIQFIQTSLSIEFSDFLNKI